MTEEQKKNTGPTVAPSWQYLYKPLKYDGTRVAVLLMNSGDASADLALDFADIPGLKCKTCNVRDIWNHRDLGTYSKSYVAKDVGSHDCAFLVIATASEQSAVMFA